MRRAFRWSLHRVQIGLVRLSLSVYRRRAPKRPISWVVGTVEIASMVANFARVIPESYSAVLAPNHFYDFKYDYQISEERDSWLKYWFAAPWVFGRLAAHARGFVYVGANGFLLSSVDDREWEFRFLRRQGIRIVCLFTGSDIRSPALMRKFQERTGYETIVTYLDLVSPARANDAYDQERKRVASVADRYADVVFNAAVDQLSYLQNATEPFPYLLPDDELLLDLSKHESTGKRIVLHAPSSPIIKGTQVVRAAIQKLKSEGYEFEYRELSGVANREVMLALREAHIVLNEFYAFVPGVFGVEAMGSGCALLTRADEFIETDLPKGSNRAWIVTTAADIYENLRKLLDNPEQIMEQASAGTAWVREHASYSTSGMNVLRTIEGKAAVANTVSSLSTQGGETR